MGFSWPYHWMWRSLGLRRRNFRNFLHKICRMIKVYPLQCAELFIKNVRLKCGLCITEVHVKMQLSIYIGLIIFFTHLPASFFVHLTISTLKTEVVYFFMYIKHALFISSSLPIILYTKLTRSRSLTHKSWIKIQVRWRYRRLW